MLVVSFGVGFRLLAPYFLLQLTKITGSDLEHALHGPKGESQGRLSYKIKQKRRPGTGGSHRALVT
jgi:hypothetical protein